jgi:hypothetical protein
MTGWPLRNTTETAFIWLGGGREVRERGGGRKSVFQLQVGINIKEPDPLRISITLTPPMGYSCPIYNTEIMLMLPNIFSIKLKFIHAQIRFYLS